MFQWGQTHEAFKWQEKLKEALEIADQWKKLACDVLEQIEKKQEETK